MQPVPVSSLAPARVVVVVVGATTCQARATATTSRRVAPAPRLCRRARATGRGGGRMTEPVEAREDTAEAGVLAAEELEVLEEAAIAGADEGRRPTDYDRRAHIFEESSRVFQELKHRRDGDGETGGGHHGGVTSGATRAGTGTREQQQQQLG